MSSPVCSSHRRFKPIFNRVAKLRLKLQTSSWIYQTLAIAKRKMWHCLSLRSWCPASGHPTCAGVTVLNTFASRRGLEMASVGLAPQSGARSGWNVPSATARHWEPLSTGALTRGLGTRTGATEMCCHPVSMHHLDVCPEHRHSLFQKLNSEMAFKE